MILPCLHTCSRDAHLAALALEACVHLDGQQDADLLLVHPDTFDITPIATLARTAFKRIHVETYPDWSGDLTWPKPQNWAWQRTAKFISHHIGLDARHTGWLWWEADALPVRKGWLNALSATFKQRPRAHFAGVRCTTFSHTAYMNGVGIYPFNVVDVLANTAALYDMRQPFDIAAGVEVMKSFKSLEPLMQHHTKQQGGSFGTTFLDIPPDAVFVHGCTDGSLHELVLGRKGIVMRAMPGRSQFYHSGDLGDVVYSLPAVRELGGGDLVLGPDNRSGMSTRAKMDERNASLLLPLLEAQPYLHSATWSSTLPTTTNHDLNSMRLLLRDYRLDMQTGYNLARCYLRTFGLALHNDEPSWLHAPDPRALAPVIINRSPRYHDPHFRWDRILDAYRGSIIFIGHPDEHAAFCRQWQCKVPFEPTATLLDAARLIAGASLFVGNQSCCYALAEGLKRPAILECCPAGSNTIFKRPNILHGVTDKTVLPAVAAAKPPRIKLKDALTIVGPADMFTGLGRVTCQLADYLHRSLSVRFNPTSQDDRLPLPQGALLAMSNPRMDQKEPRLLVSPLLNLRKHIRTGDTVFTMWESTVLPHGSADTINAYASQLIVPSSWCATVFSANGVTVPIKVVPLGVDTSIYKPLNLPRTDGAIKFGAAGRLAHGGKRKGIEDVIAAFKLAFPRDDGKALLQVKLFDDCYLPERGDDRIDFITDTLSDGQMAKWYNTLDCFISLSKGEGWGLHVQEAMACGVPVIAPSYSGLADLISHGGVPYTIVPATEGYLGHWCQPDIEVAARMLKREVDGGEYLRISHPGLSMEGMASMVKEALC